MNIQKFRGAALVFNTMCGVLEFDEETASTKVKSPLQGQEFKGPKF